MKKNSNTNFDILGILLAIWDEIEANEQIEDKTTGVEKTIVYAKALSKALEQSDPSLLVSLLTGSDGEGVMPHTRFLPLVAEVIRRPQFGYKDGRKPKKTELEKMLIYHDICRYHNLDSKNLDESYEIVADEYGISAATAKTIRTEFARNPKFPKFYQKS